MARAISVLCFCVNTLIRTPGGQMPVQDLAVGDEVMTERGVARRIVWIGTGRVLATRGRRNAATPVIVRKGALADNVPTRDLRLTKGHALFLDGALIPVEFLVNHPLDRMGRPRAGGRAVPHRAGNARRADRQRRTGRELPRRWQPWLFRNANAHWDAPPQPPCAPVLTGGRRVDALWRRLLDRAGSRPPRSAGGRSRPASAGGRRAGDASARNGKAHVFTLATRPDAIRIVSRAAARMSWASRGDPRLLGVALSRIALRQGTRFRLVEPQDPLLAEGFHAFEPDAALRWTDGDAALPMALLDGLEAPFELVLHVACTSLYPPQPALRLVA
ncbi:MAG: Hint domain-containing protein [Acetobacteraceae bacterium]